MKFPTGGGWPDWQRDYRYGALVIAPPQELAAVLDPIRERIDPVSADRVGAHITVTPPFAGAPTPADEARVASVVRRIPSMRLQLATPKQFGGSSVIYLPVVNGGAVMRLREALLATGLFRLDLPHTTDFVPHLTISEFGPTPAAALRTVIPAPGLTAFDVEAIAWVVPGEAFQFRVRRTFALEAHEWRRMACYPARVITKRRKAQQVGDPGSTVEPAASEARALATVPSAKEAPIDGAQLDAAIVRFLRRFPNETVDLQPLADELGIDPYRMQLAVESLAARRMVVAPFIEPGTAGGATMTEIGLRWLIEREGGKPADVPIALQPAKEHVRASDEAARLPRAEVYGVVKRS